MRTLRKQVLAGLAAIPKNLVQLLLAALVVLGLGHVGAGNSLRCVMFDTRGCLPKLAYAASSERAAVEPKGPLPAGYLELGAWPFVVDRFVIMDHRVVVRNVGHANLSELDVRGVTRGDVRPLGVRVVGRNALSRADESSMIRLVAQDFRPVMGWRRYAVKEEATLSFLVAHPAAECSDDCAADFLVELHCGDRCQTPFLKASVGRGGTWQ